MVPIEVFPEAMRSIAHLTPHAWAMDAFRALLFDGATLADILPQLGVFFRKDTRARRNQSGAARK
jgi:ABC-2 type transport system permease protein